VQDVWSLSPEAAVYEAVDQMARRGTGALLVMEADRWSASSPSGTTHAK